MKIPQQATNWLLLVILCFSATSYAYQPETGDLVFRTSRSNQSTAIALVTQSPYTHMGVVIVRQGKPYVFEAVATVKYTPFDKWLVGGVAGHYVIKRLKTPLDQQQQIRLANIASQYQAKRYDTHFEWSDSRLYCSELVWKMYDKALGIQIGQLQKIKDFDLSQPIVQQKIAEYYGKKPLPLDETVISPVSMFNSDFLVTVSTG